MKLRHRCIGFGVLLLLATTGCSATGVANSVERGVPDGLEVDLLSGEPAAAWIEEGKRFAIVTMGSSSCPAVATALSADGEDRVTVTFGPSPRNPCTADMAATTHTFDLPSGSNPGRLTIEVTYEDWPDVHELTLE